MKKNNPCRLSFCRCLEIRGHTRKATGMWFLMVDTLTPNKMVRSTPFPEVKTQKIRLCPYSTNLTMSEILKNEVFHLVLNRIKEKKDYLVKTGHLLQNRGIEGWLLVQLIMALKGTKNEVEEFRFRGTDLLLSSNIELELKGMNNFDVNYIKEGTHKACCMFLANGNFEEKLRELNDNYIEHVCFEIFSDSQNKWVLGIIKPKNVV